jgi:hypothetical protein
MRAARETAKLSSSIRKRVISPPETVSTKASPRSCRYSSLAMRVHRRSQLDSHRQNIVDLEAERFDQAANILENSKRGRPTHGRGSGLFGSL